MSLPTCVACHVCLMSAVNKGRRRSVSIVLFSHCISGLEHCYIMLCLNIATIYTKSRPVSDAPAVVDTSCKCISELRLTEGGQ